MPTTTPFHAKYLAHELTKRVSADSAEKLSQSLCNATVDLNPHQIEAALFAFRSPLSRGAVLADEVGLGKTIEAGLIISQLWAEKKRRILCIVPAALRKQWNRELADKFFIDSTILESRTFKEAQKRGTANPFLAGDRVVICSYQFAKARIAEVQTVAWDLVVIDEAHRLRNVYKKSNKIARAIRDAIGSRPKVLLTATPLQNSLMELYGLVTFIDPHIFGSEATYRDQYAMRGEQFTQDQFQALRGRIQPVCQRTLRRQVVEYVRFTQRISITQDFTPTDAEVQLYNNVSGYLQKPELFSLPSGQRKLITLILRKILASSSFAIAATLGTMMARLEKLKHEKKPAGDQPVTEILGDDVEDADEIEAEWKEAEGEQADESGTVKDAEKLKKLLGIQTEIDELRVFKELAESIGDNAKGQALLIALEAGFQKAAELGAPRKALDLHRIPAHAGLPAHAPGEERLRRSRRPLQWHEHRPRIEDGLQRLAQTARWRRLRRGIAYGRHAVRPGRGIPGTDRHHDRHGIGRRRREPAILQHGGELRPAVEPPAHRTAHWPLPSLRPAARRGGDQFPQPHERG